MKGYKITDRNGQTCHENIICQWGEGITNTATGDGNGLCTDGFIHFYPDKYTAVFMNPIHGRYDPAQMRMFECEAEEPIIFDFSLKCGAKTVTTIREIEVPTLTLEQRIEIGIRSAMTVNKKPNFVSWAERWLDESDRTAKSAREVAWAAVTWEEAKVAVVVAWMEEEAAKVGVDAVARAVAESVVARAVAKSVVAWEEVKAEVEAAAIEAETAAIEVEAAAAIGVDKNFDLSAIIQTVLNKENPK